MEKGEYKIVALGMLLLYLLFANLGTTISSQDIAVAEKECANSGGVSSYNTWFNNTAECVVDHSVAFKIVGYPWSDAGNTRESK